MPIFDFAPETSDAGIFTLVIPLGLLVIVLALTWALHRRLP